MFRGITYAAAFGAIFVASQVCASVPELDQISSSLIKIRGEVEQLDSEVTQLREDGKLGIQTLKVQQGELASSIEAEQLRSDQLRAQLKEIKSQLSNKGFEDQQMKSVVISAITEMKDYVNSSIPFQTEKRIIELETLVKRVERDEMTSVKAAIRLWSFVEDELRSASENSVFRQTIEVGGKQKLVEVAKLGSVFLFYKSSDDEYGTVEKQEEGWGFRPLDSAAEVKQVAFLFESLKKQIRTGDFQIPNQLKGRL
ncbi:MAG: DUF3450 family protein [Bdellovibrionales bacterium]|nr:DUF3450 family protein [Bdellovibrionales bacterium]